MKFIYDFLPIALFFITYKLYDIYTATIVAIVASILQVGIYWLKFRKFEKMHLITMVLVVVFGGATLILKDEIFIKWKPTVLNWLFALGFLWTGYFNKKTIMESMMGSVANLSKQAWQKLNISWVIYFIIMSLINLYVIYNYDTDTWMNFKFYGMTTINVLFVLGLSLFMMRFMHQTAPEES